MAKSKVFIGIIWSSIQRFGNVAIGFVSTMVMARLLTPDDFGTIGMLMFFLAIAQTFVDSGLGAALIQKRKINIDDTSTTFISNLVLAIILYFLLYILSPYIAKYYGIELLNPLLRVMGLSLIIQGFTLVQYVLFQKKLNFKTLSICSIIGTIVLAASGIISAYFGLGVWSLAIRSLAGAFTTSVLLWFYSDWRPKFIFNINSFKQLFNFGGFMLLSGLLTTISNNIHALIVGKLFSPGVLGNLTQARSLRNIPSDSIQQIIGQVLYPDFSNNQNDNILILNKLNNSVYILSYVITPLMFLCILLANPLIHFFYGNNWDEAIPYFQILCIGGLTLCLQDVNINVIKAKGKSKVLFIINICKVALYCFVIIGGSLVWGIYGCIWSMVVYSIIAYLCFAFVACRNIESNMGGQLIYIFKSIALSTFPLLLTYLLRSLINIDNYIIEILLLSLVFGLLYIVVSYVFKSSAFLYLLTNLQPNKKAK